MLVKSGRQPLFLFSQIKINPSQLIKSNSVRCVHSFLSQGRFCALHDSLCSMYPNMNLQQVIVTSPTQQLNHFLQYLYFVLHKRKPSVLYRVILGLPTTPLRSRGQRACHVAGTLCHELHYKQSASPRQLRLT